MLKRMALKILVGIAACTGQLQASSSDFITYEWLIDLAINTSYSDHIPHFRKLFNSMNVRGFLECGCGYSTKYFLDNSNKVVSIEYMTPGTSDVWFNECLTVFQDTPNWIPIAYQGSSCFSEACGYQCATHRDYSLIDPTYQLEMDAHFKSLIQQFAAEGNDIDVAFVDAGVYIRGDMVKMLLVNKIPVVVAHDTENDVGSDTDLGLYGWYKVVTPPDYEKIYIPFGMGTTFWVRKDYGDVISALQAYVERIQNVPGNGENRFIQITRFADEA